MGVAADAGSTSNGQITFLSCSSSPFSFGASATSIFILMRSRPSRSGRMRLFGSKVRKMALFFSSSSYPNWTFHFLLAQLRMRPREKKREDLIFGGNDEREIRRVPKWWCPKHHYLTFESWGKIALSNWDLAIVITNTKVEFVDDDDGRKFAIFVSPNAIIHFLFLLPSLFA